MDKLNVNVRLRNKEGVKLYSWGTLNQDVRLWTEEGRQDPGFGAPPSGPIRRLPCALSSIARWA
ncbi:hypothetical protein G4G30_02610 [Stenotrophomonas maltophilia]|nr:hypothetical protein G4G30_02610 [Stenotrophomonas maltophilia]